MKRNVWIVAGIVAVFLSAWLIKKSFKQTTKELQQSHQDNAKNPSDGTSESSNKSAGEEAAKESQPSDIVAGNTDREPSKSREGSHAVPSSETEMPSASAVKPLPSSSLGGEVPSARTDITSGETPEKVGVKSIPNKTPGSRAEDKGVQDVAGSTSKPSPPTTKAVGVQEPVATSKPTPQPTPDIRLKASPAELTCDEQWLKFSSIMKSGADLAYMTTLSVQRPLASDIATSHIETVSASSSASVTRDITFSSDHPTGILVLSSIAPAPSLAITKDLFLSGCQITGGRAANSILYKMTRIKLLDIADDSVKVGAGTFPVYRMKLGANLTVGGKVVNALVDVWMAKNKPGIPVKEVVRIPAKAFVDHGSVTIQSQLAGTRKI